MVRSFGVRSLGWFFACVILLLGLDSPVLVRSTTAQSIATATLTGTVVDHVGVVPGATVTATHLNTNTTATAISNDRGEFRLVALQPGRYTVKISMQGFKQLDIAEFALSAGEVRSLGRLTLVAGGVTETVNVTAEPTPVQTASTALPKNLTSDLLTSTQVKGRDVFGMLTTLPGSGERYAHVKPNPFNATSDQPLSTFSADVDTASYANVRRFLSTGQLPPTDAVRIEEMVNYFRFDYAEPRDGRPIALTTEVGDCPWAPTHKLVLIGARAKRPAPTEIKGRNIVLLIDVSGSMSPAERLPLLKVALAQFVDTLKPDDRMALVTYAGYSGLALPSTPASERATIQRAIAGLGASGSTNGASGIILAYQVARDAYIKGGVNRVILATDGDFNVGVTNQKDLWQLIERERESGVFLSVFGVGSGNLNDSMMEQLADRGNGNYSYLDSLQEARRVLIREGGSTLETVAKDVKFQVEFNPGEVAAWKLIGYENRHLAAKDFNDDRKDAGEVGDGHTVTVLYEIVPVGSPDASDGRVLGGIDPLRYAPAAPKQPQPRSAVAAATAGEWLTVKVRYKAPDSDWSQLITQPVRTSARVQHLPFASVVAEFGLLLRGHARNEEAWDSLARRVSAMDVPRAQIADKEGFADLVGIAAGLNKRR